MSHSSPRATSTSLLDFLLSKSEMQLCSFNRWILACEQALHLGDIDRRRSEIVFVATKEVSSIVWIYCEGHPSVSSLRASSPIWASEASLSRTRLSSAPRSRVLARLAQIGELARSLIGQIWIHHRQVELTRQKVTFHRLLPTRVNQTSAFLPRFHWKNQANFLSLKVYDAQQ